MCIRDRKDTYRLFDLFYRKNPTCLWTITTNAHWRLSDTIRKALDKIHLKNLIISLDSMHPSIYSAIRIGGRLETVLQKLDALLAYDHSRSGTKHGTGLNIKINHMIQKDNWEELGSFLDYWDRRGVETFRTFLYQPHEYSLLALSERDREGILQHYLTALRTDQLERSSRVLLPLLDSMPALIRADLMLKLQTRLKHKEDHPGPGLAPPR